jgi:signal transduction histidine kinase
MAPDPPTVRVLLVDDKPQNLLALEALLSPLPLDVVTAGSGEEALRCLLTDEFAVILLDVCMPDMDGLQTAQLIRGHERSRHTPIIFITAWGSDDAVVTRGYSLGAVDYIAKPIQPHIVRSKVAVFVELFRKTAQVRQQAAQLARLNEDLEARVAARTVEVQRALRIRDDVLAMERQAHTQAVKALQERDEFLSVAAHELKTPVTSLRGFAQVLLHVTKGETRIDASQVRRALQHIDAQAMKLDGLITQLLDLSRIEAGRLSLDPQVVDLTALVQGVVAAAQVHTSAHTLVVDAPAPIAAHLDPLRIEQVLVNLVNNAIKYSPDGGTIDIAATQHGEVAQVTVRDHGLGIPPEHREHVFDRFYQAHAHSHRSGMGLGLYISRQIVDLHGGSITADFPADGGTRFVVTLPVGGDALSTLGGS